MTDNAPPGKIWFCMMCGKMSTHLSSEAGGWDESCAMNSIAIDQGQRGPTKEQREQFAKSHATAIDNGLKAIADLTERIKRRDFRGTAELLAAAAVTRRKHHDRPQSSV